MQSWSDTPDDSVSHKTREAKREEVAHEGGAGHLAESHYGTHSSRDCSYLSGSLLPGSDGQGLCLLLDRRSGTRGRRRSRSGHRREDGTLVDNDRATNDFISKINIEGVVLSYGQQKFGDVVRI
jgi:hypothetical protein